MLHPVPFYTYMIKSIAYTAFWLFFTLTALAAEDSTHVEDRFGAGFSVRYVIHPGASVDQYLLYMPAKFRKRKPDRWPVIFFLHGKGERGYNIDLVRNVGLTQMISKGSDFPFIVIAPQCKPTAKTWEVPSLNALYADVMRRYPIDTTRVYLTGLSMGGYGTWIWASSNPSLFTAIVPICGYGIRRLDPCGMKDLPVWTFHNTDDDTIDVEETRKIVAAIKACGGTKIRYTERSTGGHDAWGRVYYGKEIFSWLLSHQKP